VRPLKLRWLAALVVSLLALAALLAAGDSAPGAAAQTDPLAGKSICLDPGHGGTEPGAVNAAFGLLEKNINLDVSTHLRGLLEGSGAAVSMTREGDETLSTRQRYEFCNATGADILVSVHTNSVSDQTIDGTLAIYFHSDDKVLATALHDAMYDHLSNVTWPFTDFGVRRDALGVVLKSDMPAAVAEPVFMSHSGEAEWLTVSIHLVDGDGVVLLDEQGNPTPNPECNNCRRAQIGQSLYDGIVSYFETAAEQPEGPGNGNGKGKKPR